MKYESLMSAGKYILAISLAISSMSSISHAESCVGVSQDLLTNMNQQINGRIEGVSDKSDSLNLYSSRYNEKPSDIPSPEKPWVRNPDLWTRNGVPLDFTGVAGWNNDVAIHGSVYAGGATLITPRHFLTASHFKFTPGTTIVFFDKDGKPVIRKVIADYFVGGSIMSPDITLGLLDRDVDPSIKYYKIVDLDYLTKALRGNTVKNVQFPIVIFHQTARAGINMARITQTVGDGTAGLQQIDKANSWYGFQDHFLTAAKSITEFGVRTEDSVDRIVRSGDSGQPNFIIINNEPVLFSSNMDGGNAPIYGRFIKEINSAIATLDRNYGVVGNYKVTEYVTSCFAQYDIPKPYARLDAGAGYAGESIGVTVFNVDLSGYSLGPVFRNQNTKSMVMLSNANGAHDFTDVFDNKGSFVVPKVVPGMYDVILSVPGFNITVPFQVYEKIESVPATPPQSVAYNYPASYSGATPSQTGTANTSPAAQPDYMPPVVDNYTSQSVDNSAGRVTYTNSSPSVTATANTSPTYTNTATQTSTATYSYNTSTSPSSSPTATANTSPTYTNTATQTSAATYSYNTSTSPSSSPTATANTSPAAQPDYMPPVVDNYTSQSVDNSAGRVTYTNSSPSVTATYTSPIYASDYKPPIVKKAEPVAPDVRTVDFTNISANSVTLVGSVENAGNDTVMRRGFQYGYTGAFGSTASDDGAFSAGAYSRRITGLNCGTIYIFRAFAKNSANTAYGQAMTFMTMPCSNPDGGSLSGSNVTTGSLSRQLMSNGSPGGNGASYQSNNLSTGGYVVQSDDSNLSNGTRYTVPSTVKVPKDISRNLKIGDSGEDVKTLQIALNSLGYKVANSGPGSPGNEVSVFDANTEKALMKYQNDQSSTGIDASGKLDNATRILLLSDIDRLQKYADQVSASSTTAKTPARITSISTFFVYVFDQLKVAANGVVKFIRGL
ncbi:MAG: peptidoglycan-binding protein [Patescibacteria group bacterium]|nr:peptidoglycan-binding protein [Patescibacteria group bacterium]